MKKAKRVISSILTAALVVSGMTGIAVPMRVEAASASKEEFDNKMQPIDDGSGITMIEEGYGKFAGCEMYFANGNPVTIEVQDGNTVLYEDDNPSVTVELPSDGRVAVFGGGAYGDYDETKITMKGGTVQYLVGGCSGTDIPYSADYGYDSYEVGRAEINMQGGTVSNLITNVSSKTGDGSGQFANCSNQLVSSANVNISGGEIIYLYGCFGYTQVDNLIMNITGSADIEALLVGATNGRLGTAQVTVNGEEVVIGEIGGCQRTMVDEITMNLNAGTVKRAISVGSIYNSGELMSVYGNNPNQFGNMHYGVVGHTDLTIGEGFDYQGIWGGMQFMPDELAAFMKIMAGSTGNRKDIIDTYFDGFDLEDPQPLGSATLHIKEAPDPDAEGSYQYLYNYGVVNFEGVVPNLLTDKVEGIEVESAPASIEIELGDETIEVGETTVATASVAMMAPVCDADEPEMNVQWSVSDGSVVDWRTNEPGSIILEGLDIGSAVITASYENIDTKVEAKAPISVGGEFDISVSPADIRLGNEVTFSAGVKRARVATASDASYEWEISDSSIADITDVDTRTMKAEIKAVGDASATLIYTDDNGNESKGSVAFSVMPPTAEITGDSTASLGDEIDLEVRVHETDGSNEELGILTDMESLDGALEIVEAEDDIYTWMVVDVPEAGAARVSATVDYPSTGEAEPIELTKDVTVEHTQHNASYDLEPGDGTAIRASLPRRLRELAEEGYLFLEEPAMTDLVIVDNLVEDGSLSVSLAEGVTEFDQEQIRVVTQSGYPVAVFTFFAPSLNAEAVDGSINVNSNIDKISIEEVSDEELSDLVSDYKPDMPEGTTMEETEYNTQVAQVINDTLDSVAGNTAVAEEDSVSNLGRAVVNAGLLANEEKAVISLEQTLDNMELEAEAITDENGVVTAVRIVPRRLVFLVEAFKEQLDENDNPIEGTRTQLDLSSDRMNRRYPFQFRLPIPESVDETYANVEHEGDDLTQYTIQGSGSGKYITVTTWHLSQFDVTFTNEQLQTSRRSGGGSSDGGSITTTGTWIHDEIGWWYRNSDGETWPSNCWIRLPWNGVTSWYRFNEQGYMVTGWYTDSAGNTYFLHDISDGTMGHMYTGWNLINGQWYYFETEGDFEGRLYRSTTTPDGYQVNDAGVWVQ